MRIANLHHQSVDNVGDLYSAVSRYFKTSDLVTTDDMLENYHKYKNYDVVIFGGGMLLKKLEKLPILDRLKKPKKIGWGIGNSRAKEKLGKYGDRPFIQKFDMISVRDYGVGLRYVPCPSCQLIQLDKEYKVEHDVVVYENTLSAPINTHLPKMGNERPIDEVIEFLGSGDTVISSSYHGIYWAQLLGRKTIAIPFGSKFNYFKNKPPLCKFRDWESALPEARVYEGFLEESRQLNHDYQEDVLDYLSGE